MYLATQIKQLPATLSDDAPYSRFSDADYLAVMCHEIGTPLSAIIGLSHILGGGACTTQQKTECAEMLRDSSHMLMGLLNDLLDSARIESGRMEIEHARFNLATVVEEAVHIIALKAKAKGLELLVHMGNGLPAELIGDSLRIRQILLNLLANAVKFTETGQIALYVNAHADSRRYCPVSITVADSGIGMSQVEIEKVFDTYVQALLSD